MPGKDFFQSSTELNTDRAGQGSLDPKVEVIEGPRQGSLDPKPEVTEDSIGAEAPIEPLSEGKIPPVQEIPTVAGDIPGVPRGIPTVPQGEVGVPPYVNNASGGVPQMGTPFYGGVVPGVGVSGNLQPNASGVMTSDPQIEISDRSAKKKKRGLIIALIVAAVLILAAAGAFTYFYMQNQKEEAEKTQNDKDSAQEVANLIASIGEVTIDSGDAITNARSHYDALTEEQQAYIPNLADLTNAEVKYAEVKAKKEAEDEAQRQRELEEQRKREEDARREAERKRTLVLPNNNSYYGDYQVVTNSGDGLVLRYGPSTSYDKILTIPYGTYLSVYGWSGEWAYVTYNNKNGWVNSNYLR